MKNHSFLSELVVRTPAMPFKSSFDEEELKVLFSSLPGREALFLASPALLESFDKWLSGGITNEKKVEKLKHSLLKYALRMHSRCTPFGTFAGCGVTNWNAQNGLKLNANEFKRTTRLDMQYTCALASELAKNQSIKPYLLFFSNTSIYRSNDKLRYVEYFYEGNKRTYQIIAIDPNPYLERILRKAKQGATLHQLALSILDDEIGIRDAEWFIEQLCEAQLLVSELEPAVTGEDPLRQIINTLKGVLDRYPNVPVLINHIRMLRAVEDELLRIDTAGVKSTGDYLKLADQLKKLSVNFDLSRLFQTDLYLKSTVLTDLQDDYPSKNVQNKLKKTLNILGQMYTQKTSGNLERFKKEFYERYGDAEIPLLKALDNESGIGYAANTNTTGDVNPLIHKLPINRYSESDTWQAKWDLTTSMLLKKLINARKENEQTIRITEADVEGLTNTTDELPNSMAVMFRNVGKQRKEDLIQLLHAGGSTAANLLGRFAVSNEEIKRVVDRIVQHEEKSNPNAVIAEIAHLPESRTGNILLRPSLREYEIPYLSNSSKPKDHQIQPDDLMVSVKDDHIFLKSKRLNKEVIPRLSNAHNYSYNALPVYHFLCSMQWNIKKEKAFNFSWGYLDQEFKFLPRVEVEGVIVSPASWKLSLSDYSNLNKDNINAWVADWNLPELFLLVDGDNELLIDTQSDLSVSMFCEMIKNRGGVKLVEFIFDEETVSVANDAGKKYTNEYIGVLLKGENQLSIQPFGKSAPVAQAYIQRDFHLGSTWGYYKFYCGLKTADELITNFILPTATELENTGCIKKWFFIRYNDPENHVRFRFNLMDTKYIGEVIQTIQLNLKESGLESKVWKVQTDSYSREIERYGSATVEYAESLFHIDSKSTAGMLDMVEEEKLKWLFVMRSVDELLSDFGYELEDKLDFITKMNNAFLKEFNADKILKKEIDKRYRKHQESMEEFLWNVDESHELFPLIELLNKKHKEQITIIQEIKTRLNQNPERISLNNLMSSYVHMHINRVFRTRQRTFEMMIYSFLWKVYKSAFARKDYYSERQPA